MAGKTTIAEGNIEAKLQTMESFVKPLYKERIHYDWVE